MNGTNWKHAKIIYKLKKKKPLKYIKLSLYLQNNHTEK